MQLGYATGEAVLVEVTSHDDSAARKRGQCRVEELETRSRIV